jgi:hypothetical protein
MTAIRGQRSRVRRPKLDDGRPGSSAYLLGTSSLIRICADQNADDKDSRPDKESRKGGDKGDLCPPDNGPLCQSHRRAHKVMPGDPPCGRRTELIIGPHCHPSRRVGQKVTIPETSQYPDFIRGCPGCRHDHEST